MTQQSEENTNEDFHIDPRLTNDTYEVLDLELSKILLANNALFPWVILVPRKNNLKELIDLNKEERHILMDEISLVSKVMQEIFSPHKLNIATLGNIVPQLHIHIIARFENDAAYPDPVFGKEKKPYDLKTCEDLTNKLISLIQAKN